MFNNLEKARIYRAIINAMKEEEKYDRNKRVVSVKEIVDLSKIRYQEMQGVLLPIKEIFSNEMEIKNLYFAKNVQGDPSLVIEMKGNDYMSFLAISRYDDMVFGFDDTSCKRIIQDKKDILNNLFNECVKYGFDQEYSIPSTSKSFIIDDTSNQLYLMDKTKSVLQIAYDYYKNMNVPNIKSSYQNIADCLDNVVNLDNLLKNIHVYEENVPKSLIKRK